MLINKKLNIMIKYILVFGVFFSSNSSRLFAQEHSLQFFGSQYVTIPHNAQLSLGDSLTVEAWVKINGSHSNDHISIISKRHAHHGGDAPGYVLGYDEPFSSQYPTHFSCAPRVYYGHLSSDFAPPMFEWFHLALTWDGSHSRLWFNGEMVDEKELSGSIITGNENLTIGGQNGNYWNRNVNGFIDGVRISSNARYDESFNPVLNYLNDEHTIALYDFNEGSGSILNDLSGNGHHGSIHGAEWSTDAPEPDEAGCTDSNACNYEPNAQDDDGSCLYEDCLGECGGDAVEDCLGECGGDAVEDCLGECGGDNVCLSIDNINGTDGSFDILYNSVENIYGFQLTIDGPSDISCSNEFFTVTNQGNLFLGFSFQGEYLEPSSDGILLSCEFTPDFDIDICFDNVIVAGGDSQTDQLNPTPYVCEDVPDCPQDCNGDCNGLAFLDSCGICSGGNSGHEADSDIDCAGDCFGDADLDSCGVCSGGNSGHEADSDIDCAGDCFGDAVFEDYYFDQDNDGLGDPNNHSEFCNALVEDEWVDNLDDEYPDCSNELGQNPYDCFNECHGIAFFDYCGDCVGGNTGLSEGYNDFDNDDICDADDETPWGNCSLDMEYNNDNTFSIFYDCNVDLYAFQLKANNIELLGCNDNEDVFLIQNNTSGNIIGFNVEGGYKQAGSGELIECSYAIVDQNECIYLSDFIFVGQESNILGADVLDTDNDSITNDCDADDDNDLKNDGQDSHRLDQYQCSDNDSDGCDDCSLGSYDPGIDDNGDGQIDSQGDGEDYDGDGICDIGDLTPYGEASISVISVFGGIIDSSVGEFNLFYESNVDFDNISFDVENVRIIDSSNENCIISGQGSRVVCDGSFSDSYSNLEHLAIFYFESLCNASTLIINNVQMLTNSNEVEDNTFINEPVTSGLVSSPNIHTAFSQPLGVQLDWDEVECADHYKVYYDDDVNFSDPIAILENTSFLDESVEYFNEYCYVIKSFNDSNQASYNLSEVCVNAFPECWVDLDIDMDLDNEDQFGLITIDMSNDWFIDSYAMDLSLGGAFYIEECSGVLSPEYEILDGNYSLFSTESSVIDTTFNGTLVSCTFKIDQINYNEEDIEIMINNFDFSFEQVSANLCNDDYLTEFDFSIDCTNTWFGEGLDIDNDGINDCETFSVDISPGFSLVSFPYLLDDNSLKSMLGEGIISDVITAGVASTWVADSSKYLGSIETIECGVGYWFNNSSNEIYSLILENNIPCDRCLEDTNGDGDDEHIINVKSDINYISYTGSESLPVSYAIPGEFNNCVEKIIGDNASAICISIDGGECQWQGSLLDQGLHLNKGYIIDIADDCVDAADEFDFYWNCPENIGRISDVDIELNDFDFQVEQSMLQSFYYFKSSDLDNVNFDEGDYLLVYNGDVLTGSRAWFNGSDYIDIAAMGYDGSQNTDGYFIPGDKPLFKLFDSTTGSINEINISSSLEWNNNTIFMIDNIIVDNQIPTEFKISSIYPNPFNPIANIDFSIPEDIKLSISIFDINGREIESIYDDIMVSGFHSISWNASHYSSGMYFLRFEMGSEIFNRKLMLVK